MVLDTQKKKSHIFYRTEIENTCMKGEHTCCCWSETVEEIDMLAK